MTPNDSTKPDPGRREAESPWDKTGALFAAALELPASERCAWLAALEGVDESIRRDVASLLEADEKADRFLAPGQIPVPESRAVEPSQGEIT